MLDAFQEDHLGSAVDTADRAPIAVPNPNATLMAAKWPSRWMRPERVSRESFHASK